MAQKPDAELGDDFSYILRLAQADVDGLKPIGMGLTSIKGVGQRTALALCDVANVDGQKLGGHLNDEELVALNEAIDTYPLQVPRWMLNRQRDLTTGDEVHLFSVDVSMVHKEDIDRLRAHKSYRGVRHALGLRVRGQRTRSNGRSGLTLGVERKK